jgi:GIY-YIG catalytic domain
MADEIKNHINYIMYKIIPKNNYLSYCYIGHTKNFSERKRQHKQQAININGNKSHQKHYETIRNNGGWDQWEMIEIEKFICKTKLEARIREQELIKEYNANLNTLNAFVTEEERNATKKAITKKYIEENKELIKEQSKKYKEANKEIIAEQTKIYKEKNKEKIYAKTKEYRENNKEKYQEQQKIWREKNKEILKEKRKIYEAKKKQQKLENKIILTEEYDSII